MAVFRLSLGGRPLFWAVGGADDSLPGTFHQYQGLQSRSRNLLHPIIAFFLLDSKVADVV
jgi:hypothetical protein